MAPLPHEFAETLLTVDSVTRTLGGAPILRGLSFEIRNVVRPGLTQGQVVGLLGPSGMGKTTLFRLLSGLDAPDAGTIIAEGEPVRRGTVGVVAQNYPLFAHRTVRSNLMVAQPGVGRAAARTQADALLERFGLADQANKYPCQLSGGQRQRVAIAQQFLCSRHFLLMDEPFSGLDLLAAQEVSRFIKETALTDEHKTFILVTHDVSAALQVCDTILLLGRDRDAQGNPVPGARIQQTYSLIERGLAWRDEIDKTPEFIELYQEIRAMFPRL